MGRVLTSKASTALPIWQREGYAARPVWEYITQAGHATQFRTVFGPNDTVNYIEFSHMNATVNGRSRSWGRTSDEVSNHNMWIGANATLGTDARSWSPKDGFWGITGFSQTGTCNNWYSSYTEFGYIDGNDSAQVLSRSTPVILPEAENQTFELITLDTTVGVYPLGVTWGAHINNNMLPRVNLAELSGFQAASGQVATNFGMASYNARIGVYVILLRTGTSGGSYRLHVFPIGKHVRGHTTFGELRQAFIDAMSGYRFIDLTLNGLTHTDNANDRYAHKLCLCDDGSLWVVVTDTSNATSNAQGLRVFRITDSVLSVDGPVTLSQYVQSGTSGAHYGLGASVHYGTRHMMSDDNSVMAVYTHYYYYLSGAVGRFLPTDSVNNSAIGCRGFSYADTGRPHSIAPTGGSSFAICRGENKDGAAAWLWFIDPRFSTLPETGSDTSQRVVYGAYVQRNDGAMYQGQFVNKILPLDRFK